MLKKIQLSNRLKQVASYLSKGTTFADIGSDHAYLPCYVCSNDKKAKAIAGEVNEGPFMRAKETVHNCELSKAVDVRLGNGLQILNNKDQVQELVIAGMGGALIKNILEEGYTNLTSIQRIISQPNVDARSVRKWYYENRFVITNETIVKEHGRIYEIIVADKENEKNPYDESMKEQQLLFGPLLLKNRPKEFLEKWREEFKKRSQVVEQMKDAKQQDKKKMVHFERELDWIREVLQNDEAFNNC